MMGVEKVKEICKDSPAFTLYPDLASEKLGGMVLYATDDFFAEKENLIKPGRGIFIEDKYTDRGKWMDGWESRRKRTEGHDWAVIKLATPGKIYGFDIDTNFFLGNHPPKASIEAISLNLDNAVTDWAKLEWEEVLPESNLDAGSQNFFECNNSKVFTHCRLHIYPDGGVARFRVYGDVYKNWNEVNDDEIIDLASALNGARSIACNDMFFSSMHNLIMPDRGANMGDGWETKRNRTPGNCDWMIVKLAMPGVIDNIIVDTCHFKGNYPDKCFIEGCNSNNDSDVIENAVSWQSILPLQKLSADMEHTYKSEIISKEIFTHVRLNILPDGGISRLRIFGKKSK